MDGVDDTAARLAIGSQPNGGIEESPSLLTVAIDTHTEGWLHGTDVREVVSSLLVFLNAHLAMNSANLISVVGYNSNGAQWIYPETQASHQKVTLENIMFRQFHKIGERVASAIRTQLEQEPPRDGTACAVSGALSLALCYTDRLMRSTASNLRGRILVITASSDAPAKYIATMNSIFAAQKLRVPIDVLNFGAHTSSTTFLQQAADFTGGACLDVTPAQAQGLVQILMGVFLLDPAIRDSVYVPTSPDVDFSAVCFVSKKVIEIGYVCSVCLCIMEKVPENYHCPVCGTLYEHGPGIVEAQEPSQSQMHID